MFLLSFFLSFLLFFLIFFSFQDTESDEVFRTADRNPSCAVRQVGEHILWFELLVDFLTGA